MTETILHLTPAFFSERERVLVEHGPLTASAFRYDSGVVALRLKNELGELVMLPFQGQQIWSAEFGGRDLTMKSMFSQPTATRSYLENYGGFPAPLRRDRDGRACRRRHASAPRRAAQRAVSEGVVGCGRRCARRIPGARRRV